MTWKKSDYERENGSAPTSLKSSAVGAECSFRTATGNGQLA